MGQVMNFFLRFLGLGSKRGFGRQVTATSLEDGKNRLVGLDFCESMVEILGIVDSMLTLQPGVPGSKDGFSLHIDSAGKVTAVVEQNSEQADELMFQNSGGFSISVDESIRQDPDFGLGYFQRTAIRYLGEDRLRNAMKRWST